MFFSWWRPLLNQSSQPPPFGGRRARRIRRAACKPWVESLEDRTLLNAATPNAGTLDPTFNGGMPITADLKDHLDLDPGVIALPGGQIQVVGATDTNGAFVQRYDQGGNALGALVHIDNKNQFNPNGANPAVIVSQPDGQILTATSAGNSAGEGFTLARYGPNGSLDTSFNGGAGAVFFSLGSNQGMGFTLPSMLVVDPASDSLNAGKIFVGTVDANTNNHVLMRFNADGTPDPTFNDNHGAAVLASAASALAPYALAVYPSSDAADAGKLLVAFADGGMGTTQLRRYDSGGHLDTMFGSGGQVSLPVNPVIEIGSLPGPDLLLIQPDGKAVLAGTSSGAVVGAVVERLDTHGNSDSQFGASGSGMATLNPPSGAVVNLQAVALQTDGNLVVAGSQIDGPKFSFAIARFTAAGQQDAGGFGTGGLTSTAFANDAFGTDLAVQPDGNLLVAGIMNSPGGEPQELALARYLGSAPSTGTAAGVVTYLSVGNVQPDDPGVQPPWTPAFTGQGSHSAQGDLLTLSDPNDHTADTAYYYRTEPTFNAAADAALEANFLIKPSQFGALQATPGSVSLGMGDGAKLMQLDLISVDNASDTATFVLSQNNDNAIVVHNADHLNSVRIVKSTADGMVHVFVNDKDVLDTAYAGLPGDTNPVPGTFLFGATAGGSVTEWQRVRYVVGGTDLNAGSTPGAGQTGGALVAAFNAVRSGQQQGAASLAAAFDARAFRTLDVAQPADQAATVPTFVHGDLMEIDFTYQPRSASETNPRGTAPQGLLLFNIRNGTAENAGTLALVHPLNPQDTTLSHTWVIQVPLSIFPSGPANVAYFGTYSDGTGTPVTVSEFTVVDSSAVPPPAVTITDDKGQPIQDTASDLLGFFGLVDKRTVAPHSTFTFNVQGQAAQGDALRLIPLSTPGFPFPPGLVLLSTLHQPVTEADGTGVVSFQGAFTPDASQAGQDYTVQFLVIDGTTNRTATIFLGLHVATSQEVPDVLLHTAPTSSTLVPFNPNGLSTVDLTIQVDRPLASNTLPGLKVQLLIPLAAGSLATPLQDVGPNDLVNGTMVPVPGVPNRYEATYILSDGVNQPGTQFLFQASATDPGTQLDGFSNVVTVELGDAAQVIQAAADTGDPQQEQQQVAGQQNGFVSFLGNVGQGIQQGASFVANGLGSGLNAVGNGATSVFNFLTTPRQSATNAQNVYTFSDGQGHQVAYYTTLSPFDPATGRLLTFSEIVSRGGGSIVSRGGGSIVSRGGGSIVSRGGGSLYTREDGSQVFIPDGALGGYGNLVSRGGGSLVSHGGGSFRIGAIFATSDIGDVSRDTALLPLPNLSAADIVSRGGGSLVPGFASEFDVNGTPFRLDPNSILSKGAGNLVDPNHLFNPSQLAGIRQNTPGADESRIPQDASMLLSKGAGNLTGMSAVAFRASPLVLRAAAPVAAAVAPAATTPAGLPAAPGAAAFDAILHAQFLLWEDELLQSAGGVEPASPSRTDLGFAELKAAAAVLKTGSYDGLTADQVAALQRAGNIIQLHVAPATPGAAIVPGSRIVLTPVTSGVSLATATATPANGQPTAIALGGTVVTIGGDISPSPEPGVPTVDVPLFGQDLPLVAAAPGQVVAQLPDFVEIGVPQLIALTTADGRLAFGVVTLQPSAGAVQFGAPTYTADPSGGTATVTVTRSGGSAGEVVVDFATADGSAQAGTDYTRRFGTVVFANGDAAPKTIAIPLARTQAAGDRTISVSLSDLIDGTAFGANATTTVVLPGTAPKSSGAPPSSGGPVLSPSQRLVAQAFADLLGQLADAGTLAALVRRLDRGASPLQVVRDVERLPGFATRLVREVYHRLLHRPPHRKELRDGLGMLGHGASLQELEARVLAGTAYFTERAGGTGAGFRDALVRDLLGLLAAPAADAAVAGALQGERARLDLARRALQTLGSDQRLARVLYELAHVRANQHGFRRAIDLLQAGQSGQDVLARIVAATLGGPAL